MPFCSCNLRALQQMPAHLLPCLPYSLLLRLDLRPVPLFTTAWPVFTGLATLAAGLQASLAQTLSGPNSTSSNPAILIDSEHRERREGIWAGEIGGGFRSSAQSVNLGIGASAGFPVFGGRQSHHLALSSLTYGHMLGSVVGDAHWYRGNWEIRAELFGGTEFSPETEWMIGLTPHLRYNFATGTRWVPFADIGAGVTATSIGPPDLSDYFEFNLKAGGGVQWFIKDNVALSFEAYYLHLSCAGMSHPNQGLNGITGMFGVSVFF